VIQPTESLSYVGWTTSFRISLSNWTFRISLSNLSGKPIHLLPSEPIHLLPPPPLFTKLNLTSSFTLISLEFVLFLENMCHRYTVTRAWMNLSLSMLLLFVLVLSKMLLSYCCILSSIIAHIQMLIDELLKPREYGGWGLGWSSFYSFKFHNLIRK